MPIEGTATIRAALIQRLMLTPMASSRISRARS
jgi:hypothetical protein